MRLDSPPPSSRKSCIRCSNGTLTSIGVEASRASAGVAGGDGGRGRDRHRVAERHLTTVISCTQNRARHGSTCR